MTRSFVGLVLVGVILVGMPQAAIARDSGEYSPARKLGRSVSNISLGVLAVPGQIARTTSKSGPFVGVTWGLARGLAFMAATEVVGVFELVTAPFATPPDFKPIMKPEFPWQYFTETPREERR